MRATRPPPTAMIEREVITVKYTDYVRAHARRGLLRCILVSLRRKAAMV